jgi:hypothetical protein
MTMNKHQKIIDLLSKVLAGDMSPEVALDSWPVAEKSDDKFIKKAWHLLCHYSIDDDIRAKDKSYEASQRHAIEEIVAELNSTRQP